MPPIVLASTSRYRAELLARLQLPFVAVAPNVDESPCINELPAATAMRLSVEKAQAVTSSYMNSLIIGSDQIAARIIPGHARECLNVAATPTVVPST